MLIGVGAVGVPGRGAEHDDPVPYPQKHKAGQGLTVRTRKREKELLTREQRGPRSSEQDKENPEQHRREVLRRQRSQHHRGADGDRKRLTAPCRDTEREHKDGKRHQTAPDGNGKTRVNNRLKPRSRHRDREPQREKA